MTDSFYIERGFGLIRQEPDHRDRRFSAAPPKTFPDRLSLRSKMSPVWDQGPLGSCTSFGSTAAAILALHKAGRRRFTPAWMATYWWARSLESTVDQDAGATIRDAMKALDKFGVPLSRTWPYDPSRFSVEPSRAATLSAAAHQITQYEAVDQSRQGIKTCLIDDRAVVFGFAVYESFISDQMAQTGVMPVPRPGEGIVGYHCVDVVGYPDDEMVECRNSWGTSWGKRGYFYMPWSFLLHPDMAFDFWTVEAIEAP